MRIKLLLFIPLLLLVYCSTFGQNKSVISGKILDGKNAEPLIGAIIQVKGTTLGGVSDYNGLFSISGLEEGNYTLECSSLSYQSKTITDVIVKKNEVTNLVIVLDKNTNSIKTIKITSSAKRETNAGLLMAQKNSASVSDGVSSELIRRTPDKNTSDVLKRVSGASIQDNKFVVVRGLNDRYNAAYLNGAPLPSSESDRKAFSFDIFPSAMLDNLVIIKTATPDMPGEFAGGIIQITTKDIPEKNFYSFSLSGGYNTITTGKTQLTYNGSSTDWLGYDNGSRDFPYGVPNPNTSAFPTLSSVQGNLAKKLTTDWSIEQQKFSPNLSLQYSMGLTKEITKNHPLALVVAVSYNKSNEYSEKKINTFVTQNDTSQIQHNYLDRTYSTKILTGAMANLSYKINKNNSISFKNLFSTNSDNKVINRTGDVDAASTNPIIENKNDRFFSSIKIYSGQLNGDHYWKPTRIKINLIGSFSQITRDIPNERLSVYTRSKNHDTNSSDYTDTLWKANISSTNVGSDYGGGMFWAHTAEKLKSFKLTFSRQLNFDFGLQNEIKIGGLIQYRDRDFEAKRIGYTQYAPPGSVTLKFNDNLLYLPQDQIFSPQNMGIIKPHINGSGVLGVSGFKLSSGSRYNDAYTASANNNAAFIMLDNKYKFARLVWGARVESYRQRLFSHQSQYAKDDINLDSTIVDVLPSGNLILSLSKKQNLRFSYYKTLNRPEFRELAPFEFYDFVTELSISGTPNLQRAVINNYDARYEFYPGRAQLLSASFFYKNFTNPIEQILWNDHEMRYANVPSAKNYGVEFEFRTLLASLLKKDSSKFLNNLTAFSNLSIIRSQVNTLGQTSLEESGRPLQGQSPYVFNAGLMYNNEKKGATVTFSFNRVGPRIYYVGGSGFLALWESSRSLFDIQFAKLFLKKRLELKLNIQNVFAQNQIFYENKYNALERNKSGVEKFFNNLIYGDSQNKNSYEPTFDNTVWTIKYGRIFSLTASYKF